MNRKLGLTAFSIIAAAATMMACGPERASAPRSPDRSLIGSLTGTLLGTVNDVLQVTVLHRNASLASDVTWSFVAQPGGASSYNSQTGLRIVVPSGAVSVPTTITVRALAGNVVAYDFQPQGLHFAKAITLEQSLGLTDFLGLPLGTTINGAYYGSSTLQYDPTTGIADVQELEPTTVDLLSLTARIQVSHFSGYVVASGRR